MKKVLSLVLSFIILLMFGVPLIVLTTSEETSHETEAGGNEVSVRVLDRKSGKIKILPLEQYLVGVVSAEMPANFEEEALKAQAVAARTYTVKRMFAFGGKPNPEHPEAEVCTDPAHCQAWNDQAEQKEKWGALRYLTNIERIRTAVRATRGQIITYNNLPIDPVYHGSCGGKGTENSEDVWSNETPYLRGVDCDAEYKASEQKETVNIDKNKLLQAVNSNQTAAPTLAAWSGSIIKPTRTSSRGRVQEVLISGKRVSGTELRKILGLNSTSLVWDTNGSSIAFTTTGKGHAVGLCQYGANGLALEGKTFKDILLHYYTGVTIKKL